MIHPQQRRAAGALLVALLLVVSLAGPVGLAAAQSDDGDRDDSILGDVLDIEVSGLGDTVDGFLGLAAGMIDRGAASVGGPDRSVADCRDDLMAEFNQHNSTYIEELNAKTSPSSDRDVLRVRCIEDPRRPWADSEASSFYVVANVSAGTYQSARAVESTDRSVDETIVLRRIAREQMADDLAAYRETFIEGNDTVGKGYERRMTSKYAGAVYGTIGPLPSIPEEYDDLDDTEGGDGS